VSLTTRTITHTVQNADGTAGSGTITFTLSKRITNGSTTVLPAPVVATLNGSGAISVNLYSNQDTGTFPADSTYRVDFRLLYAGSQEETFYITVPVGPGTTDLGSLLPANQYGG
jgi:hypothetical protein